MNPTIKALRAIGSTFAWRIFIPIVIITTIVTLLLIGLNIWLVTLSPWWWILFAIIIALALIAATLFIVIGILIKTVQPTQSAAQKREVERFVDKIQNVADVAGTPKALILFRITRDLISRKEDSYTRRISSETLSMQHDLRDIIDGYK